MEIETKVFIVSITLLVLIYDLLVYLRYGENSTISVVMRKWDFKYKFISHVICFIAGLVIGHIFLSKV
jgi:hypothetical protein